MWPATRWDLALVARGAVCCLAWAPAAWQHAVAQRSTPCFPHMKQGQAQRIIPAHPCAGLVGRPRCAGPLLPVWGGVCGGRGRGGGGVRPSCAATAGPDPSSPLTPLRPAAAAALQEERYVEIRDEMRHMLAKVGWKPDFVEKSVPVLPISGWMGDNLIKQSEKMGWWKGQDVDVSGARRGAAAACPGLGGGGVWEGGASAPRPSWCVACPSGAELTPPPPPAPPPPPPAAQRPQEPHHHPAHRPERHGGAARAQGRRTPARPHLRRLQDQGWVGSSPWRPGGCPAAAPTWATASLAGWLAGRRGSHMACLAVVRGGTCLQRAPPPCCPTPHTPSPPVPPRPARRCG